MKSYVLTVSCKSTRGIVAAITGYLAEEGCYISDSSQFDDLETGLFFMRLTFISQEGASLEKLTEGFEAVKTKFGMVADIRDSEHRMKVLLMVSRFGHCLNDLLYRWKIGALPIDIVGVISNHFDYQKVVVNHDIPFHHIPVTKANKAQANRIDGKSLCDTKDPLNKMRPTAKPGIGPAFARVSCRIACFRRHPVSEVCHRSGVLLAFPRNALPHASQKSYGACSPGTWQSLQ